MKFKVGDWVIRHFGRDKRRVQIIKINSISYHNKPYNRVWYNRPHDGTPAWTLQKYLSLDEEYMNTLTLKKALGIPD